MFWCCCGNEPVVQENFKLYVSGFSEYFVDASEVVFPNRTKTGALVRTVGFAVGKIAVPHTPPGLTALGQTAPLFVTSFLRNIFWGGVMVKVPANIGQTITSAILRLQYGLIGQTNPTQPIPVKAYVSRRSFTLPNIPADDIQLTDISPDPFGPSSPNKRPWQSGVYGTIPNTYTEFPDGVWGSGLTPWITPVITATCNAQVWSVDVTAQIQTFINNATINNPYAFILMFTDIAAPVMLQNDLGGVGRFNALQESVPNYLQLTF